MESLQLDGTDFKKEQSDASARLDAELKVKITKAMEKAFKHFDTDRSNTIDVEEFIEVLRALGQDLSSKEVKSILKKASRNSEVLHFEDFERAVFPFLREKLYQSAKVSEPMLRTTFQVRVRVRVAGTQTRHLRRSEAFCLSFPCQMIDTDGGGNLSRQEVKYAFVDQLKLLTEKEASALVAALDRNNDNVVSWEEFRRAFQMIQVRA